MKVYYDDEEWRVEGENKTLHLDMLQMVMAMGTPGQQPTEATHAGVVLGKVKDTPTFIVLDEILDQGWSAFTEKLVNKKDEWWIKELKYLPDADIIKKRLWEVEGLASYSIAGYDERRRAIFRGKTSLWPYFRSFDHTATLVKIRGWLMVQEDQTKEIAGKLIDDGTVKVASTCAAILQLVKLPWREIAQRPIARALLLGLADMDLDRQVIEEEGRVVRNEPRWTEPYPPRWGTEGSRRR
jgi:hypothetical protein